MPLPREAFKAAGLDALGKSRQVGDRVIGVLTPIHAVKPFANHFAGSMVRAGRHLGADKFFQFDRE